jgi:hypothetical protein
VFECLCVVVVHVALENKQLKGENKRRIREGCTEDSTLITAGIVDYMGDVPQYRYG